MKKFLIIFALFVFAGSALSAATWLKINDTRFLYVPSIKREGIITSVWVKVLNQKNMKIASNKNAAYTMLHHQYDCINKKVRIDKIVVYNSKDEIISKGKPNSEWKNIPSKSLFETEGGLLCTYNLKKKTKK